MYESVAQLDRAIACGAIGRAFESRRAHFSMRRIQGSNLLVLFGHWFSKPTHYRPAHPPFLYILLYFTAKEVQDIKSPYVPVAQLD